MGGTALTRCFLAGRHVEGAEILVDKSEEKSSTEVTDGRKCNPTGSDILRRLIACGIEDPGKDVLSGPTLRLISRGYYAVW